MGLQATYYASARADGYDKNGRDGQKKGGFVATNEATDAEHRPEDVVVGGGLGVLLVAGPVLDTF